MAAKEMDNPIDAIFVEYLIAEPGVQVRQDHIGGTVAGVDVQPL